MTVQIHPLVKDTHDIQLSLVEPVEDDMAADPEPPQAGSLDIMHGAKLGSLRKLINAVAELADVFFALS
jgi:hypothetical protein